MKVQIALLSLLLAAPLATQAGDLDYTYVEGGAMRHYPDMSAWDQPERRNGAYLRGSFAFGEKLYAYGDISRTTGESARFMAGGPDIAWFDYKYTLGQFGLGAHHPLNDHTDALVELAYVHLKERRSTTYRPFPTAATRFSNSEKGTQLRLGLREALTERVEGWMKVGYISMHRGSPVDNGYTGEAGIQFKITPRWGVVADAQYLQAVTTYSLGVRANF